MAHYFDDIFTRHLDGQKSRRGSRSRSRPFLRRSSTARSIGARSDFDNSVNGDDEDDGESIGNSVGHEDPERTQRVNGRLAEYVSEQLERVRSNDSWGVENNEDEYEAQLDGQ
jgi:hypothetical protein